MSIQIADYLGIDVSMNNGSIDWNKVVQDPQKIRFAYIKATEGTTYVDPTFDENRKGATAAGLKNGAYHFYSLATPPINQAYNFINKVHALGVSDLPPMLDIEKQPMPADLAQYEADLHTWLDTVEKALGQKPIIYTAYYYWHDLFKNPVSFASYPLGVAQYGPGGAPRPATSLPLVFGGWTEWALWQYSSIGNVEGIVDQRGRPLAVDIDRYNVNSGVLKL